MSKQTIRKSKPKNKYMSLPNKTARNTDLSYEALGMLVYIQSLPENWILHVSTLPRVGCGRDKAYRIISELLEKGYAKRTKVLNKKRQVVCVEYEISDNPDFLGDSESTRIADEPLTENPYTENPDTDEPYTENKELQRQDSSKKVVEEEISSPTPATRDDALFNEMKDAVKKCLKQYKKASIENIANTLLCRHTGKKTDMNLSRPITVAELIKFCDGWSKKKDSQGNPLSMPANMESIHRNVQNWLEIIDKQAQKPARANISYDFTPDMRSEAEIRAAMEQGES